MDLLQISFRKQTVSDPDSDTGYQTGYRRLWIQSSFSGFAKLSVEALKHWALKKTYSPIIPDTLWPELSTNSVKHQLTLCSAAVQPRTSESCQG